MTDWKAMARALGLPVPEADLATRTAALAALEPGFQRLAATLTPDVEMAPIFDPAAEDDAG
jgi:hypothetical protein